MMEFDVIAGTPGLEIDDVAHVLIPGRGRDGTGTDISLSGYDRVFHAEAFYREQHLAEKAGVLVCCGYKTPADRAGELWTPDDSPHETFSGVPEADSYARTLIARGIAKSVIRTERHSIDTVTNLIRAEHEGHFGDDRPVAIVAQETHLQRIIEVIAPKTLRRDFLGIIVPEPQPIAIDSRAARIESQAVLLGINPESCNIIDRTDRRARVIWGIVGAVQRLSPSKATYQTDAV